MDKFKFEDGQWYKLIIRKRVFRKGKFVGPKTRKALAFWVKVDKPD